MGSLMDHLGLCLRIEQLVKKILGLHLLKESNIQHLGGLIEADGILNKCAFAAFCAGLTPYYINNSTEEEKMLINQFINKYNWLPALDDARYWEVLKDAVDDYEKLLQKLNIKVE